MLGSLVSALGSLASGIFGRSAARDAQETQSRMAQQNIDLQREFAQNGIQWRVADANKAGVHPLAALGAQTVSFSPVSVGGEVDNSMSTAMSNIGQDLGRAINATRSSDQRDAAYEKSLRDLQLTGAGLDNDIKRATLASSIQRLKANANPSFPSSSAIWPNTKVTQAPTMSAQDAEDRWHEAGGFFQGLSNVWNDYKATTGSYPLNIGLNPPRASADFTWIKKAVGWGER